jgi:hypothetical protein
MEKYIVFGPIIIFFGFFGLLILGFFMLVGKLVLKSKNDSWVGEVIDKSDFIKDKDDSNLKEHILSLKVQMENGETHSIPASRDFYNEIKVGDKLKKDKGSLWPKKIS